MGHKAGDYFVYALAGLEVLAGFSYALLEGDARRTVFWLCLATANLMMAGIK